MRGRGCVTWFYFTGDLEEKMAKKKKSEGGKADVVSNGTKGTDSFCSQDEVKGFLWANEDMRKEYEAYCNTREDIRCIKKVFISPSSCCCP